MTATKPPPHTSSVLKAFLNGVLGPFLRNTGVKPPEPQFGFNTPSVAAVTPPPALAVHPMIKWKRGLLIRTGLIVSNEGDPGARWDRVPTTAFTRSMASIGNKARSKVERKSELVKTEGARENKKVRIRWTEM